MVCMPSVSSKRVARERNASASHAAPTLVDETVAAAIGAQSGLVAIAPVKSCIIGSPALGIWELVAAAEAALLRVVAIALLAIAVDPVGPPPVEVPRATLSTAAARMVLSAV